MKKLFLIIAFVIACSIGVEAQRTPPRPPAPPHPTAIKKKKPVKKKPSKAISKNRNSARAELQREHNRRVKKANAHARKRPAPRTPPAPPLPPRP